MNASVLTDKKNSFTVSSCFSCDMNQSSITYLPHADQMLTARGEIYAAVAKLLIVSFSV